MPAKSSVCLAGHTVLTGKKKKKQWLHRIRVDTGFLCVGLPLPLH